MFDIATKKTKEIAPLNCAVARCCCTAFNNSYIYKFHGISGTSEKIKLCGTIERYDIEANKWINISPIIRKD